MTSAESPRVLICRLSALGDCVHTLPVVCALRRHFPQAFLAWVTQTSSAALLSGHVAIDELIEAPKGYLKSPQALLALRKRLRKLRIDIAVDPQSLTKSAVAGWLSGARQRIGFAPPLGREAAPWLNSENVVANKGHAVEQNLQLLAPLGIHAPPIEFQLPVNHVAKEKIETWLAAAGVENRLVVVHPGAGWDSKLWVLDRYAEVARHLGESHGLKTVVAWAGSRQRLWAEQIVANAGGHAVLAPETSLPELIALLRAARLYVGSDSGPLHMAAAAGTPTVSMFGPSRPEHNGPFGAGHVVVQAYYQAGTTRERKRADNVAMRAIASELVIAACEEQLRRKNAA